jgi:Gnt-I system high-affinity gluconate transporter
MTFLIVLLCIVILIVLIAGLKFNTFVAFLLVSILAGVLFGLPVDKIMGSVEHGIGDTLSSLVIIISLGAMLGKIVAESGAAQKIASVLVSVFGKKYLQWALMVTGFIIGIPLFYGVGFVLMVPLIFSIVYEYKMPAIYIGLPMLAALSVTHGFLPPHPSPTALLGLLHGNMGITLMYGFLLAIPAIIIAGPVFASTLKKMHTEPLDIFRPKHTEARVLPGTANSFITSLLPVFLLIITTALPYIITNPPAWLKPILVFISAPSVVMIVSVLIAAFTLGTGMGKSLKDIGNIYSDAVKDIGMILLIIAGAGALKQVLADSGVSAQIAAGLQTLPLHPLFLGWLMAAIIRVCIGSATIAGLTTGGIIAPLLLQAHVNPNLMVLSIGAGSLFLSHVNDSGFWLFKEYFNLSIKDTFRTWSVMESIISIVGLAGIFIMNSIIS